MKKVKKVKKPSLPKLKKQAWKLWSEIVRHQAYCDYCGIKYKEINPRGKPCILNAHHIIGRENHRLSWDVMNGVCLCQYCHKFSRLGPHKGGIIFSDWFMKKYPVFYEYLLKEYRQEVELTVEYMQKIIDSLTVVLNNLKCKETTDVK